MVRTSRFAGFVAVAGMVACAMLMWPTESQAHDTLFAKKFDTIEAGIADLKLEVQNAKALAEAGLSNIGNQSLAIDNLYKIANEHKARLDELGAGGMPSAAAEPEQTVLDTAESEGDTGDGKKPPG